MINETMKPIELNVLDGLPPMGVFNYSESNQFVRLQTREKPDSIKPTQVSNRQFPQIITKVVVWSFRDSCLELPCAEGSALQCCSLTAALATFHSNKTICLFGTVHWRWERPGNEATVEPLLTLQGRQRIYPRNQQSTVLWLLTWQPCATKN